MTLRFAMTSAAAFVALASAAVAEPNDAARAIAQKFYEASEPKAAPTPAPPAKAPTAAKPLQVAKPAQTSKPAPAPQQPRVADPVKPGADYELEMLDQARQEQIERQNGYRITPSAQFIRAVAGSGVSDDAPTVRLPVAAQDLMLRPAPVTTERAIAAPMPALAQAPTPTTKATQEPPAAPDKASDIKGERATVLVVLDDMISASGVRPDPILCFDQQCWISNGLEAPAKPMPRSTAVALKTTATQMGDSCSGKSACAFRNIPIVPDAPVELVEVGESRGVARGNYTIAADTSCRKDGDELLCNNPLVTHEFRMWVVPEKTAQAVGPSLLEGAIADSLPDGDDAPDDGK